MFVAGRKEQVSSKSVKMFIFLNVSFSCHIKEKADKEEKISCFFTCEQHVTLTLKIKNPNSTFPETEKMRPQYLKEPMKREY